MNRSAEHRLGKFLNLSKHAEAVLGAPFAAGNSAGWSA